MAAFPLAALVACTAPGAAVAPGATSAGVDAAAGPDGSTPHDTVPGSSDTMPSSSDTAPRATSDSAAGIDIASDSKVFADALVSTDAAPPNPDANLDTVGVGPATDKFGLAFVTLLTGKVVVVERKSLEAQAVIGAGHGHTHGVGVLPGQQAVWYGNTDDEALDRYEQVNGDPTNWKLVASVKAPGMFKFVEISRNGAMMALAPDIHFVTANSMPPSKQVLLFDTKTQMFAPPVELAAPTVVALTADGATAYVANTLTKSIDVIDTKSAKATASWTWPACALKAPQSILTSIDTTPDDKTLALCTFGGRTLAIYDLVKPGPPLVVKFPMYVHWVVFSPDSKTAFVVTVEGMSIPGDEKKNAAMPTTLERVDVATGTVLGSTKWKYGYAHIGMPPTGTSVFVTGSFSTLLEYDAATLGLLAEGPVQPGLPTPAMTISF